MWRLVIRGTLLAVLVQATAGANQKSDTNTSAEPDKASVADFLTPDGRFDLEAARRSGYQGPLDMKGYVPAFDSASGQPVFRSTGAASPADDPDDIYWDNTISPSVAGVEYSVHAATVYDGLLIVGGRFKIAGDVIANYIAAWDGSSWSPLGSGMNSVVYALTVYDNRLIAGGYFTTAGGVAANCIAAWDGSSWSPLGSGMNGWVEALTVYNNQLIAGGVFTTAGGLAANRIAAWDGSSWSPLGSGMGGGDYPSVCALTVYDNRLIAGGYFITAGAVAANYVAAWDGSSWSPLGSGMEGPDYPHDYTYVYALTVYDNRLIAGGWFTTAGGVAASDIAAWDGSSWSPLGSGMNGSVIALTVYNGNLIAGGGFTTAGGTGANYIASWDGTAWSPLGSGMNDYVRALTVYNGNLIAGGEFWTAGGTSSNRIASWDGTAWSPLGSGMNDHVFALTVYNGNLIAAGWFTTAGGTSANRIASWDGTAWSPLGSGMNAYYVHALTVYNGNLIAGGSFTSAGNRVSAYLAQWTEVAAFCDGFAGIFCDDFEDGVVTQWQSLRNDGCIWTEVDGVVSTSISGMEQWCIQSVGDQTWTNYVVEADVRGNAGVDKVLVFRIQDADNFYAVNLRSDYPDPGIDQLTFDKMVGGVYDADIATANVASENGVWYELRVECLDNDFYVYVDDAIALEHTDDIDPYYTGGIGVACWTGYDPGQYCDISFDNVAVTEPTVPHIHLSPTSLSFSATQNGPLPAPQTLTISNVGGETLDWYVDEQILWLDLDDWEDYNNYQDITVSINTTGLEPGTHNGTMTATSSNADNSPQYINVTYTVSEPQASLITCEIDDPEEDFWAMLGHSKGLTASVRDDLGNPVPGSELQSIVAAFTGAIPSMPLYDDGLHGDGSEEDGVYGADFIPADLGALTIVVTAEHPTLDPSADTRGGTVYNAVSTTELKARLQSLRDKVRAHLQQTVAMAAYYGAKGFDKIYETDFEKGKDLANSLFHIDASFGMEVARNDIMNVLKQHPKGIGGSLATLAAKLAWKAVEMNEAGLLNTFATAMDGSEFPDLTLNQRETYLYDLYRDQTAMVCDLEDYTFSSYIDLLNDIDQCYNSVSVPDYLPDICNVADLVDELDRVEKAFAESTPADAGRTPAIERQVTWKLPRAGNCDITEANHFVLGSSNDICQMYVNELSDVAAANTVGGAVSLGCFGLTVGTALTVVLAPTVVGSALFAPFTVASGAFCLGGPIASGYVEMKGKYEVGVYILELNSSWPDDVARSHSYFSKVCSDIQALVNDPRPGDCSNNVELLSVTSPDICYVSSTVRYERAEIVLQNHDPYKEAAFVVAMEIWAEDDADADAMKPVATYYSYPSTIDPGTEHTLQLRYSAPPADGFLGLGKNYYWSTFRILTSGIDYEALSRFKCVSLSMCILFGESDNQAVILQELVYQDEEVASVYTASSGTVESSISMIYHGSDVDMHIYDAQNNHVGHNYQTGLDEILIPGATYSGHESNPEIIELPDTDGQTYQVVVKGISVVNSEYVHVSVLEEGQRPAILSAGRESVELYGARGDSLHFVLGLREIGGQQPVENIQLTSTDLIEPVAYIIPSDAVHLGTAPSTILPESIELVNCYLRVPNDAEIGIYSGQIDIQSSGGSFSIPMIVTVDTSSVGCCIGRVGDANGLGGDEPTIGDVSVMIDAKFITGTCEGILDCFTEADINQSGGDDPTCDNITIGDISTLIDYLFITGTTLGLAECL